MNRIPAADVVLALRAHWAARLPTGTADGIGADPAAGGARAAGVVGRAILLSLRFLSAIEGSVVFEAAAVGGAAHSAGAACAAVRAADRIGERATSPEQLGPLGVAGGLRGEAVHLPLHGRGWNHLTLKMVRYPLDWRATLQIGVLIQVGRKYVRTC